MSIVKGLRIEVLEVQGTLGVLLINTITQLGEQVKGIILQQNLTIDLVCHHREKVE